MIEGITRSDSLASGLDVLADLGHQVGEPGLGNVEGLAAGDAREGDGGQRVAVLLVVADDAGLAREGAVDGQVVIDLMRRRSSALAREAREK